MAGSGTPTYRKGLEERKAKRLEAFRQREIAKFPPRGMYAVLRKAAKERKRLRENARMRDYKSRQKLARIMLPFIEGGMNELDDAG